MDSAFMGRSTPTTAFDGAIWYFADTLRHIEHICMKEFIIFFGQILLKSSFQNPSFFTDSYYVGGI